MNTLYLLIVLSQNGAGDINASFVNTETLQQCQQKALIVEDIFKASNIPVIESRCAKSSLQFSEFAHASSSVKIRHFYQVHFDETAVQISAIADWLSCMKQHKAAKLGRVYCSSSIQSVR
jgi:hypothetical protein